jgi:hypothetical protein
MGRLNHDQRQLFYSFRLEDAVPDDHLVRAIAGVLDLSWVHAELARETFDRSGAYDSDAGRWLRFCDSLGTSTLPGRTSQSCLPLVLYQSKTRFRTIPRSRVHAVTESTGG